jgi:hypothetical protein
VDLDLVEEAGGGCELRGCGAMDQHVLVARGLLGPGHRGLPITWDTSALHNSDGQVSKKASGSSSGRASTSAFKKRTPSSAARIVRAPLG